MIDLASSLANVRLGYPLNTGQLKEGAGGSWFDQFTTNDFFKVFRLKLLTKTNIARRAAQLLKQKKGLF